MKNELCDFVGEIAIELNFPIKKRRLLYHFIVKVKIFWNMQIPFSLSNTTQQVYVLKLAKFKCHNMKFINLIIPITHHS